MASSRNSDSTGFLDFSAFFFLKVVGAWDSSCPLRLATLVKYCTQQCTARLFPPKKRNKCQAHYLSKRRRCLWRFCVRWAVFSSSPHLLGVLQVAQTITTIQFPLHNTAIHMHTVQGTLVTPSLCHLPSLFSSVLKTGMNAMKWQCQEAFLVSLLASGLLCRRCGSTLWHCCVLSPEYNPGGKVDDKCSLQMDGNEVYIDGTIPDWMHTSVSAWKTLSVPIILQM